MERILDLAAPPAREAGYVILRLPLEVALTSGLVAAPLSRPLPVRDVADPSMRTADYDLEWGKG